MRPETVTRVVWMTRAVKKAPLPVTAPGSVLGRLTVVEEKGCKCFCRCSCSAKTEKWIDKYSLKSGRTTSCGCLHREISATKRTAMNVAISIAATPEGSEFGRLTVIENTGNGMCKCRCRCDGKMVYVVTGNLKSGDTKSCGCIKNERTPSLHLKSVEIKAARNAIHIPVNAEIGNWVVVKDEGGDKVLCKCKCGQIEKWLYRSKIEKSKCNCARTLVLVARTVKPIFKGEKFGRLVVLEYFGETCKCVCIEHEHPREVVVNSTHLRTGHTISCGCYQAEMATINATVSVMPGTVYGKLTVLDQHGNACRCRCDCSAGVSREVFVKTKRLRAGHTKSCGCLRFDICKRMSQGKFLGSGVSGQRYKFMLIQNNAIERGLEFNLTRDEVRSITTANCHYCGSPSVKLSHFGKGGCAYNGIDRMDNEAGYVVTNVVSACRMCNRAKSDSSYADFISWVLKIGSYPLVQEIEKSETDIGKISGLGKAFNSYRHRARRKKFDFKITLHDFWKISQRNCSYCGIGPVNVRAGFAHNGIDRMNNAVGYVVENLCCACRRCNAAKGDGFKSDFTEWLGKLVQHQKLKLRCS